jgi:hypothetical protein
MRFPRLTRLITLGLGAAWSFLAIGCGGSPNAEQVLNSHLKQEKIERQKVYPLAGHVTIDGHPPGSDTNVVIVVLNETRSPQVPVEKRPRVVCTPAGEFSFSAYLADDGFPPGDYILTFAMLAETKRGFHGPDQLKNLYNDPEKNKSIPEFHIDHKPPGRKDYAFDLKLAGKEPVEPAGQFALTAPANSPKVKREQR